MDISQRNIFGFTVVLKPPEDYLEMAVRDQLDQLEIDLLYKYNCIDSFDDERILKLNQFAEQHNLRYSLHTPYCLNPAEAVVEIRRHVVEYLKNCVRLAKKLNATHLTTHLGYCIGLPTWDWLRKAGFERLCDTLNQVSEVCGELKLPLALENVNPMPKGMQFFYLGDKIGDLEHIFREVNHPYVRFCLDVGHANTAEGPMEYIRKFPDRIINVHYHDNHGTQDEHLNIGEGSMPWKAILAELFKLGFHGPFISECFNETQIQSKTKLISYM